MTASRALPLAVLGGLVASLLFVAALTGSFGGLILFWMAPLPLFVVGLRLGMRPLVFAGVVGTVAVGAGDPAWGLAFAATAALPVLLLTGIALVVPAERSAGALVLGLTGLGVLAFGVTCLLAVDQDGGLQGVITTAVKDAATQNAQQFPQLPAFPADMLDGIGRWLLGFFVALWLVIFAGNGILAHGAVGWFGGGLAPAPAMASIALPRVVSIGFAAALVAAIAGSGEIAFVGINLAEILAMPLMFGGLGVVHAALARNPARAVWLTVFYAVFLGIGLTIAVIVALGVIEQWVGLRQRFAPAPRRGEE